MIVKLINRSLLGAWFLWTGLICMFGENTDPKASAKKILALRAAAEKARMYLHGTADANGTAFDELSNLLSREMLERVEEFKAKKKGQIPTEKWLENWRMEELQKSVTETVQWAKEQSPLPIEEAEVLKRAASDWAKEAPAKAQEYARQSLNQVYQKARDLAASEQLKHLQNNLSYPNKEDLNARLNQLFEEKTKGLSPLAMDDFAVLDEWLQSMIGETGPVFEEARKKVAEMSTDMRLEIAKQYKAQFEQVKGMVQKNEFPQNLKTRMEMKAVALQVLAGEFESNLNARPPVYGVFDASEKLVERAAVHWENKRFDEFLKEKDFWLPGKDAVEKAIRGDLVNHVSTGKSLKLLTEKYLNNARQKLALEYGGQKWSEYFILAFTKGESVARSLDNRLREGLKQRSSEVRKDLAGEQFKADFKDLLDPPFPKESQVLWFYENGKKKAAGFSDVLRGLSLSFDSQSKFLDETKSMAVERVNEALVPALFSLQKQIESVHLMEKEHIGQLREDVTAGREFAEILQEWQSRWNELWEEKKQHVDQRWQPQFEQTAKELSKVVRKLYEGMENSVEQTHSSTSPPSEELGGDADNSTSDAVPTQNEQPEPQKKEEKSEQTAKGGTENKTEGITEELKAYIGLADGVFAFSDLPNGRCRMLFGAPSGAGGFILEFDPQNVQGAAKLISEGLKRPLGIVLEKNSKKENPGFFNLLGSSDGDSEIKMLFQVLSPAVRHQMSILVRQQVEEAISSWAKKKGKLAPELLWQDDVEF